MTFEKWACKSCLFAKGPRRKRGCFRDVQTLAFHSWKPICFAIQFWGCQQRSTALVHPNIMAGILSDHQIFSKTITINSIAGSILHLSCVLRMMHTSTILEAIPGRPYFVLKAFKKVWNMDQMRFACYDSSWNINFKIKEICFSFM